MGRAAVAVAAVLLQLAAYGVSQEAVTQCLHAHQAGSAAYLDCVRQYDGQLQQLEQRRWLEFRSRQ